jgi:hypothetical protein
VLEIEDCAMRVRHAVEVSKVCGNVPTLRT